MSRILTKYVKVKVIRVQFFNLCNYLYPFKTNNFSLIFLHIIKNNRDILNVRITVLITALVMVLVRTHPVYIFKNFHFHVSEQWKFKNHVYN